MDSSTYFNLLNVLQQALSQNPEILKPAEEQLKLWETQPCFYSALLNVITDQNIDVNIRWMAVLYMKNGIDKYWRKLAPNAISEQEKQQIKIDIISRFNEPINQIATQRAVLISKIARIDCPREWPELLPTLLSAVENSDLLIQHRALLTLHHVIKSICSKRLPGDRRIFHEFASNVYGYILNLWNTLTESFISNVVQNNDTNLTVANLEKALLTLRILRKLTVFGFYKPHENVHCVEFLKVIFEKGKKSLECRKQLENKGAYVLELCEKYINHLIKVLLSVLDIHPLSYIDLINPTLEFTMFYLFTQEGIQFLYERFVIQSFNLIKGILLCLEYKSYLYSKSWDTTKYTGSVRASEIKIAFFQPNVLTEICRRLVSHYFLLSKNELDTWEADPETFVNDESGDSWKYSLRPSMETVFVTIFHEFRDILAPVILEMIGETNSLVPPEDLQDILKKEAVYNAVELAAFDLYEEVEFDAWFMSTLLKEVKIKHPNYKIIRRRIGSLMGKWVGIKLSTDLRPVLYQCLIDLLSPEEDLAVRLTASATLRAAIDDFEFNSEQFAKFLAPSFDLLFTLLKETKECETKMHILNVMSLMVERVGHTIQPHSDSLIQYLPLLWEESEEHNMLRCAIVSTLVQLVKALGEVVPELMPFLFPIIKLGTDTKQSAIVYLLEDSLELWLTILENSPAMTDEMVYLFDNMPALLDQSTENFKLCLWIVIAHMLLAPDLVMKSQTFEIMTILDNHMADMKNEGILVIARLVETFIKANPNFGAEACLPVLPRIFEGVYEGEKYPMIMSLYLTIIARVLLSSHSVFSRVLSTLAAAHNENEEITIGKIITVWLNKMSQVSQLEHRKLLGLALANLLTTQNRLVYENFAKIMLCIMEILNDITKADESGNSVDSLLLSEDRSPSYFTDVGHYDTDHERRKRQLLHMDPVHNIALKDYLQSQLFALKNQLGSIQYEQLLSLMDSETFTQLKEYYVSF